MTREEAKTIILKHQFAFASMPDDVIEAINYLVKEEPRWILVSEKLPEKNIEVLITTEWDCITIGEMFSNNDWFIHEGATTTNIDDITAWMPLPKPYREVEE